MQWFSLWWKATRPFAFSGSAIPVFLGTLLALKTIEFSKYNFSSFFLTLLGVVLLHAIGNMVNDFFDHKKEIDSGIYGSRGVLVTGEMPPKTLLKGVGVFLFFTILIGMILVFRHGFFVLWLGLIGTFLALSYTTPPFHLKYRALGDLVIVLAFGPLVALGSYMVQTQKFSWDPIFLSLPITLLIDAVLHSNNTRDFEIDREKNISTLANQLGLRGAKIFYDFLLGGAYGLILIFVLLGLLPFLSFITFLTLPFAWKLHQKMKNKEKIPPAIFAHIDAQTAKLHLLFGGLLCLSLLLK